MKGRTRNDALTSTRDPLATSLRPSSLPVDMTIHFLALKASLELGLPLDFLLLRGFGCLRGVIGRARFTFPRFLCFGGRRLACRGLRGDLLIGLYY